MAFFLSHLTDTDIKLFKSTFIHGMMDNIVCWYLNFVVQDYKQKLQKLLLNK